MTECGCEVKKGVRDDSGFMSGDAVIDRKREARETGCVEDKELYISDMFTLRNSRTSS